MATATDAERLLNDPAWKAIDQAVKDDLIRQIEESTVDGSDESRERLLEACRMLQTRKKYVRSLSALVDRGKLKTRDDERKERYRQSGVS